MRQQIQKEDVEKQIRSISERVERALVDQKREEISIPITRETRRIDGIMKRDALESAKSLAQAITKGRLEDWC